MSNPAYYAHPVRGWLSPSSTPWTREESLRRRLPLYRSEVPCPNCGKKEPDRFVRSDTCQWCTMLDAGRFVRGEPLVALQLHPEDKLRERPGKWIDAPGIDLSLYEDGDGSNGELAQYGIDRSLTEQEKRDRGLRIFVEGGREAGRPCQWAPHFEHLNGDGECEICKREAPTARQQIEARLGEGMSRDDCEKMGYLAYLGKPCQNGHEGWRYINGNRCFHCFEIAKDSRREYTPSRLPAAEQFAANVPVSYAEALDRGLLLYFGNPCKKAKHSGWRRVKGKACYECSLPTAPTSERRRIMCMQLNNEQRPDKAEAKERDLPLYWVDGVWFRSDDSPLVLPPSDMDATLCQAFGYEVTYEEATGWIPL